MDLKEIQELIKMVEESKLTTVELEKEGLKIVLKKESEKILCREKSEGVVISSLGSQFSPGEAHTAEYSVGKEVQAAKDTQDAKSSQTVNSPIVGTFYASSSPGGEPFVEAGSTVNKGAVLCIIEAMKLMNEIEAEENLQITKVLVKDGQMVEFGQPLFEVQSL